MKKRVLLLSTVHPAADPRIRYKIAPALSSDYEVHCALPHLKGGDPGIRFASLPFFKKLLPRLLVSHPLALLKCISIRPDILHIFVPELIPLAWVCEVFGVKVIYEVQENLFKKFEIKSYNNNPLFQWLFQYFDQVARRRFHLIFTEEAYLKEYSELRFPFAVVRNFAVPAFYQNIEKRISKDPVFLYVGVVSLGRCLDVMLVAFSQFKEKYPDFRVHFFGPLRISPGALTHLPGYQSVRENVIFHGYTDQKIAFKTAGEAIAGLALLRPVADYPDSYTTKLFEYMSAGLPIITSDFPLYRDVVENHRCGFCVDPENASLLYEKMCWLAENPTETNAMGRRGKQAVLHYYNWKSEAEKLLNFYDSLL